MPSLKSLLGELLSGPVRGAKTTYSSTQNLRNLLGQSLFPQEYDYQGNPINAGVVPFFGLPRGNFFEGIAARPPQGIQEIPIPKDILSGIESYRDPFIHIPERNLTIIPKQQNIGRDSYAHGELAEAYGRWLAEKGYHDTAPRIQGVPDLWRGGKNAPIQGEIRHADIDYDSGGWDAGNFPMNPNYGKPIRKKDPDVNIFTTKRQTHPELIARLAERYPKSRLKFDDPDPIAPAEIRQAKKRAARKHPGRKVEKPYIQRRRSGR